MQAWRHRATTAEVGERLDRFLQAALPDLTRSRIKRLTEQGHVLVNGLTTKAGHPLREGDEISLRIPASEPLTLEPQDIPVGIVYEDEHLLVVDKPAGLTVHPGAGRPSGTLVNALLGRGTSLSPVGGPHRPGIVHRLDKGTSGLLVVARTEAAHLALSRALAARDIKRRYWALVWGAPEANRGTIDAPLGRSRADRRRMRVVDRGGREAVTRYRVLWEDREVTALWLALETGRTHQIRAHFRHLGYPVFGDPDYGGRSRRALSLPRPARERVRGALAKLDRQALHAAALEFEHPATGQRLAFHSPLPEDIVAAVQSLELPAAATKFGSVEES